MISREVSSILKSAFKHALNLRHEYILTEHLLFSVCSNEKGVAILRECGVDIKEIKPLLKDYLENKVNCFLRSEDFQPVSSVVIERVMDRAITQCIDSDKKLCEIGDVLVSLMQEEDCYSFSLLKSYGVTKLKIMEFITLDQEFKNKEESEKEETKKKDEEFLRQFCIDLNEQARSKNIDLLVGREREVQEILAILARRKKNNPILVGDPGVGKTAIVEGLALMIEQKKIHPFFRDFHIYSLEVGALVAGTRFRGDFEERVKRIFALLKKKERVVVFIDEIHVIVGTGATGNSQLDISNLLKPLLVNSFISCIGVTTFREYRQTFQKDHAFSRRFEKVEIHALSKEESFKVLSRLKNTYEKFHGVSYQREALMTIVELASRYFPEKKLPDAGIDLLDLSAAMLKIERQESKEKPSEVTKEDIERIVSKMTNIPVEKMGQKEKDILEHLEEKVKEEIFDQDDAISTVVKAIKISRAHLMEKDKPIANFLFAGPTGVGKTELCRVLARLLNLNFIRMDMSEYMEAHSVSKIIGAPPGYVGHGEINTQLTEKIRRNPHSLLLLDEIEKTHRDVLNIFLQIMDYGKLTDSLGNRVSFNNVLIVMTSNAGAHEMMAGGIGFFEERKMSHRANDGLNQFFSPEFRNRLSAVIHFNPLTERVARLIVKKIWREFNQIFVAKKVKVHLEDQVVDFFASKGTSQRMGARPIRRLLESEIKQSIVDDILFGQLAAGGEVYFSITGEKLQKKIIAKKKKVSLPPKISKEIKNTAKTNHHVKDEKKESDFF